MRRLRTGAAGLVLTVALGVIGQADAVAQEGYLQVPGGEYDWFVVEPYGTVLRKFIWNNHRIAVCWDEAPADAEEQRKRELVKDAVEDSWPRYADVDFVGWDRCEGPRADGVHIVVRDVMPATRGLGNYLNRRPGGVVLNFTLDQWRPACRTTTTRDDCLRYLAVHEFGHVLGFVHEQVRNDAPAECKAEVGTRGARGDWKVTVYDPKSIMNYCSDVWSLYSGGPAPATGARVEALSARDREAVAKVYGSRTRPANNIASAGSST